MKVQYEKKTRNSVGDDQVYIPTSDAKATSPSDVIPNSISKHEARKGRCRRQKRVSGTSSKRR